MPARTLLHIGTVKGLYTFESDAGRREWRLHEPLLPEWEISTLLMDPEDSDRLLTGTTHYAYGATVRETRDRGASWSQTALRPPETEAPHPLKRVWQLVRSPHGDTLYAGVEEAALWRSGDGGSSWSEVEGLSGHPSRPHWMPGAGGLCLHSILLDPDDPTRMWVAISAVGVFGTTDGGETWTAMNAGLPPMTTTGSPDEDAMFCIHRIVRDPADGRLFMQFHAHTMTPDGERSSGVFRSDDDAASWTAIDGDLPRKFGFPMALSERGELFVAPLVGDENRVFDEGRPTVWRSRDGGGAWDRLDMPVEAPVYTGVLRDAMALDGTEPTGIYFGTTGGDVWASPDGGDSWQRLPGRLPRILSVRALTYA
ncbi:MAG TPA: sialidase family protein [Gemmatimonadota bacterium]|nr:sialidase family protein [Gemmatimonadota bacterium]